MPRAASIRSSRFKMELWSWVTEDCEARSSFWDSSTSSWIAAAYRNCKLSYCAQSNVTYISTRLEHTSRLCLATSPTRRWASDLTFHLPDAVSSQAPTLVILTVRNTFSRRQLTSIPSSLVSSAPQQPTPTWVSKADPFLTYRMP